MSERPRPVFRPAPEGRKVPVWAGLAVGWGIILLLAIGAFYWFVVRVEVGPNEILILVNKTSKPIPTDIDDAFNDQVVLYPALVEAIAARTGESAEVIRHRYMGIQYEVLPAGRYFFNPYSYKRIVAPATIIGQHEVGVLIRKFGEPLPFPKTVATEPDERGPVEQLLMPGRYNINTLAYDVQRFPAIEVPPGHVGVVTLLSGRDPVTKNTYTVEPGEKGVQRETLSPGLEYYNPYLKKIEIVDVRSQKYDMRNEDAIHFPSNDSFDITIEATIEWAIRPDRVAEVTVAYGDQSEILNKIILPNARSISRIQGSKLKASEFIAGRTRTLLQERLLAELREECWKQGVDIKDALIRDIIPPTEIATPISEREQADQEIERATNEMEEARAQARLVEQQEMQQQNRAIGDARREVVSVTKEAEQRKIVAVTGARRQLEVAELQLQASEKQADALKARGQAEANVVLFEYRARAEPLEMAVQAFGDGETYAQLFFLERIAPSIQSIQSNTEGPFADIFKQFQTFPAIGQKGGDQ